MKKILLFSLISFCSFLSVNAQWTSATNLQSTPNNVAISNNIAGSEVKLLIGNTNLSGYSVIRFGDVNGEVKGALHRFNSGWVTPAGGAMWEPSSVGLYEFIGSMNIGGKSSFKVFTGSENSERLRVDANGNVGIGTTTPQVKLHIANGDNSYGAILAQATEAEFQLYTKTLTTQPSAGQDWNNFESFRIGMKYSLNGINNESNGFISFYRGGSANGGYLGFSTAGTERIRISASGYVGIGTNNPSSQFEVAGNDGVTSKVRVKNPSVGGNGGYMDITMKDDPYAAGMRAYVPTGQPGYDRVFLGLYTTTYNGTAVTSRVERLTITDKGFVGINCTNPDKELTVKGTIHAREVLVDLNGPLADFVFAPSYKLKSLAEVEAFVKENNHLPEIPSAAEAKANGVNLGEMQNKLLQKIEELTLYTIELEKSRNELVINQTEMQKSQSELEISRNEEIQKRVELEARLAKLEALLSQK